MKTQQIDNPKTHELGQAEQPQPVLQLKVKSELKAGFWKRIRRDWNRPMVKRPAG